MFHSPSLINFKNIPPSLYSTILLDRFVCHNGWSLQALSAYVLLAGIPAMSCIMLLPPAPAPLSRATPPPPPLSPFWTASFGLPKAIPSLLLLLPPTCAASGPAASPPALLPRRPAACAGLQPILGFLKCQQVQEFGENCGKSGTFLVNNLRAPVETVAQSVCS